MPPLVYRPSPLRPFCLEKFLRVQVPLGCVKTAFVIQELGSREFVKTYGSELTCTAQKHIEQDSLDFDAHHDHDLVFGFLAGLFC